MCYNAASDSQHRQPNCEKEGEAGSGCGEASLAVLGAAADAFVHSCS